MNSILCQEIKEVNQQISIIEAECAILRELLKPWPKQKPDQAKQKKEDTVTAKEKHLDEDFGPEEKQTLKQVEELLSRAQKTLQSKLTEILDEEKNNTSAIDISSTNTSKNLSGDNQQPPNKEDLNAKELQCKEKPQNLRKSSQVVMKPKQPGIATTKSDASNSSKLKQNNIVAEKKTSRPRSNTRHSSAKLQSSRSSYVPVHMLAPFKTEQPVKWPRSKSTLAPTKSKTPAAKQVTVCYTVAANQPFDQCQKNEGAKEVKRSSNRAKVSHSTGNNNNNCTPSTAPDNETVGDRLGSLDTGEDFSQTRSLPEQEFTLSSGCLKLPGKLKKLASKNQALRDQCYAAKSKHKGSPDLAQQFTDKLEAQTQIGKELRTQASALTCLRSHQILRETLENLHLDKISENSSFESIYRAKRYLEFILNKFAELQDEAEMFSKVQSRNPQDVKKQTESNQDYCWMDTGQHHTHSDKKDKYLQYHLKMSKEWTGLQFQENYLRLQIRLTEQFYSEWHSKLTSNKWEPSVVQGAYSLLTSFGQNLPALVKNPD